jgi:hypothetical protein
MQKGLLTWIASGSALAVLGFALLVSVAMQAAAAANLGQNSGCTAQAVSDASTPQADASARTAPTPEATTATNEGKSICYPASRYGAAVVQWARAMADALYVNPACSSKRGGSCNETWYTSAFPKEVIAYGENWCQAHGDCSDWANGTYQCVSFVRGAYSQVYPMQLTNDAFGLWGTYSHVAGWQEIPAAATANMAERFLPEPGDVMVFKDLGIGHVAIVMAVQAPVGNRNGWIEFANANSSSAYDRMPLLPNLLVDTQEWAASGEQFSIWGYIRPKPAASAALVRISQLDPSQYANTSEYQTWAYSACSAAAMTEVLNAYGEHLRVECQLVSVDAAN